MSSSALSILLMVAMGTSAGAQPKCPMGSGAKVIFPDTVIFSSGLQVNPDGAAQSYVPGDHGYTYINDGVNLISDGKKVSCSVSENEASCRAAWFKAEQGNFAAGTPEFCSFAIEVVPVVPGAELQDCEDRKGRSIIGNGKGRPADGRAVLNVSGERVVTYLSTTSLHHLIAGKDTYTDSSVLPGVVVPEARGDLLGAVAWVRYGKRSVFAIVNDTGPAFGEGTIALYQGLLYDTPPPEQPVGPIPLPKRCGPAEMLQRPFASRSDLGHDDRCRAHYAARAQADIRASAGIEIGVETIILAAVKPPMEGHLAKIEVTPAALRKLAVDAGYDDVRLAAMADCLRKH